MSANFRRKNKSYVNLINCSFILKCKLNVAIKKVKPHFSLDNSDNFAFFLYL